MNTTPTTIRGGQQLLLLYSYSLEIPINMNISKTYPLVGLRITTCVRTLITTKEVKENEYQHNTNHY